MSLGSRSLEQGPENHEASWRGRAPALMSSISLIELGLSVLICKVEIQELPHQLRVRIQCAGVCAELTQRLLPP